MSTRDRYGDDPDATLVHGADPLAPRRPVAPTEHTKAYGTSGFSPARAGPGGDLTRVTPTPSLTPRDDQPTLPALAPRDDQPTLPALAPRDDQMTLPALAPRDDQMTLPVAALSALPRGLPVVRSGQRPGTLPYAPDAGPPSHAPQHTLIAAPRSRPPLPPLQERAIDQTLPVAPPVAAARPLPPALPTPRAPAPPAPRGASPSTLRWIALAVLVSVVFALAFALARRPAETQLRTDPRAITPSP